mmetsp:Transcript_25026/g.78945  ORF Transcript_25026/g.78945 Transcript_25026/m.78945 type:complete len:322 (-) Transcript_25026:57-1022(-)
MPAMATVTTGSQVVWQGRELYVACSHRPTPKDGVLLLCLHGAYCNRGDFSWLVECEALRNCGVLAVDLPGHGASTKMRADSEERFPAKLEEMAEVVWELLGAMGLQRSERVLVVGHSLGGTVGLLLAARYLRRPQLHAFVSLEGCLVGTDTSPNGIAARWMRKDPASVSAQDLLEDITAAQHLGKDPAGMKHWREAAVECGETVHLLAVQMSRSLYDLCHSGELPGCLDGLPPFHYVYGTASGKFTPTLSDALKGRRNVRMHGICPRGHFLLLDGVEAILGIIVGAVAEAEAMAETSAEAAADKKVAEVVHEPACKVARLA